jgi:hypothetical protein
LPRSRCHFAAVTFLAILIAARALSQTVSAGAATANPRSPEAAVITGVKVVQDHGHPAVEIDSTYPVIPAIQSLDSPPRLVIELPNSRSGMPEKKIQVLQGNILTIRIESSRSDPPGLKIILTFLIPHTFTWDSEGNRLMVRLKPPEDPYAASRPRATERPKEDQPKEEQPKVFSAQSDKEPAVVPVTSGVGDVLLAGRRFAAGSSLTAGNETAVLQLARGGQIHVCPGTTLSVTPSKSSKDLMLGLSTGALETHYALSASADTVLTPDFRIVFRGPGEFDYAISSDSKGDTCVRGLRGNAGSAVVSELIGDRTYQVKPSEQAVFRSGRIDKIDTNVPLECGCPPPVPVMRTDASSPNLVHDSDSANVTLAQGDAAASNSGRPERNPANSAPENQAAAATGGSGFQPLPHDNSEVHMQVEAPLVFQGKSIPPATAAIEQATALPVTEPSRLVTLEATALPPAVDAKPEHHGIMGRIRGFFAKIFR